MTATGAAFDTATTAGVASLTTMNREDFRDNDRSRSRRTARTLWAYCYRVLILILGYGGIVLSILASVSTCEFLKYQTSTATSSLDSPFDGRTSGWVGIFQFKIIIDNNGDAIDKNGIETVAANITASSTFNEGGCVWYDGQFVNATNEVILTSQFCAVIAPSLALIAMIITTVESCCCMPLFRGSFVATSIFLLLSAFTQGLTFAIFAEPTFCFNNNGCDVGNAGIFSACASFAFFMACLLFCCSPIPTPCLVSSSLLRRSKSRNDNGNDSNDCRQQQAEESQSRLEADIEENKENFTDPTETKPTITATCTPTI